MRTSIRLLSTTCCCVLLAACGSDRPDYSLDDSQNLVGRSAPRRVCTDVAVRLVASAYLLAVPIYDPNALAQFIAENRSQFGPDGQATKCTQALGAKIVQAGLESFSQADYDQAYGRALEMGAPSMDMAHDVAGSVTSGSLDYLLMGQELQWLGRVLPEAAAGDWTKYNTTGTQSRQSFRAVLPLLQQMMGPQGSLDRAIMEQYVGQAMSIYTEMVQWQIPVLAQMLDV